MCVWTASHLIIFVPGQGLGGEDKPVLLGSSLHDADVVDGQPALPDHLRHRQTHRQKANNNKKKNIHQIKNLNFSHTFHKHRICQPVHVTHTHTHTYLHEHVCGSTVKCNVTASSGDKKQLPQTTAGWHSPTRLHTLFFLSFSALYFILSTIQKL